VPIRVASGHAPAAAAASPQRGTPFSVASRPGGIETRTPDRNSCPSGREKLAVNAPDARASVVEVAAPKPGANGGPPQPVTSTAAGALTGALPDHGSYATAPSARPQPGGAAMTARRPPANCPAAAGRRRPRR